MNERETSFSFNVCVFFYRPLLNSSSGANFRTLYTHTHTRGLWRSNKQATNSVDLNIIFNWCFFFFFLFVEFALQTAIRNNGVELKQWIRRDVSRSGLYDAETEGETIRGRSFENNRNFRMAATPKSDADGERNGKWVILFRWLRAMFSFGWRKETRKHHSLWANVLETRYLCHSLWSIESINNNIGNVRSCERVFFVSFSHVERGNELQIGRYVRIFP